MTLETYVPIDKAAFQKMTPPERRTAIAKDVLAAIRAARFRPVQGIYLSAELPADAVGKDTAAALVGCEACALGAAFVSLAGVDPLTIQPYDTYSYPEGTPAVSAHVPGWRQVREHLSKIFDDMQLDLIENAFEGGDINYPDDEDDEDLYQDAANLIYGGTPDERMQAVMQNIVDHGGDFDARATAVSL